MHWKGLTVWAAAVLSGLASGNAQDGTSSKYVDSLTGFTFSQVAAKYSIDGKAITYRIAVPSDATMGSSYDVVLQVVAPVDVGWAGLAWNGAMTSCPLTVAWQNGQTVTISSRWATSHVLPGAYSGATYQLLKSGTRVNGTHWQFTALCSGCTQFRTVTLNPTGSNRLAMAYSAQKPSNPASNTSSFPVHTVHDYWNHDFGQGANPSFSTLVAQNGGHVARALPEWKS